MPYGLDFSEVRHVTDHDGNRIKTEVPSAMFSMLVEFWIAARRAATLKIEKETPRRQFKGSLGDLPIEATEAPADDTAPRITSSPFAHDRKWEALVSNMPDAPAEKPERTVETPAEVPAVSSTVDDAPAPIEAAESPAIDEGTSSAPKSKPSRVFYREFMDKPPAEVLAAIKGGTYFLRAWRELRGLTLGDAAELYGRDKTTILWHESGKSAPTPQTLEKFAQLYDVPLLQMIPKPGTDDSPFVLKTRGRKPQDSVPNVSTDEALTPAPVKRKAREKPIKVAAELPKSLPENPAALYAPLGTHFPPGVMSLMRDGKSPMEAWRIYRNLTIEQLAIEYGCTVNNLKAIESKPNMRGRTIERLCAIFHCKPAQMRLPSPDEHDETPAPGFSPNEPVRDVTAMAAAFMQAESGNVQNASHA